MTDCFKIQHPNAAASVPTSTATGPLGYSVNSTDCNSGDGTGLNAEWLNAVTVALEGLVDGSGVDDNTCEDVLYRAVLAISPRVIEASCGDTAPVGASDGDFWVNTAVDPNVLNEFQGTWGAFDLSTVHPLSQVCCIGSGAIYTIKGGVLVGGDTGAATLDVLDFAGSRLNQTGLPYTVPDGVTHVLAFGNAVGGGGGPVDQFVSGLFPVTAGDLFAGSYGTSSFILTLNGASAMIGDASAGTSSISPLAAATLLNETFPQPGGLSPASGIELFPMA